MKAEIKARTEKYEIFLQQITQLLGIDMKKKEFILNSFEKYFSGAKYASYQEDMQDNIRIEGQEVGRKYFSCYRIRTREELIKAIKLSKTSMMMQYLVAKYADFECRVEQDAIGEHLERLYLNINEELKRNIANVEIGYDIKNMLDVISDSAVFGIEGRELERLSDVMLLETYLDLLAQLQEREPKKLLIIIDNIDHLLNYEEYQAIYVKMKEMTEKSDSWFLISSSIQGFVILNTENLEELQVINDIIFGLPSYEHILSFIKKEYPIEHQWKEEEILEGLKSVIQEIGKEKCKIDIKGKIFLKLLNQTLGLETVTLSTANSLEMAFLMEKNML